MLRVFVQKYNKRIEKESEALRKNEKVLQVTSSDRSSHDDSPYNRVQT
ncbi:MAG: hypothetical protein P4M11_14595 [Candidatus Pacebacteria bacterium]|nr:hypothetical protein [Candidatus Paceibacterota bacterium]